MYINDISEFKNKYVATLIDGIAILAMPSGNEETREKLQRSINKI